MHLDKRPSAQSSATGQSSRLLQATQRIAGPPSHSTSAQAAQKKILASKHLQETIPMQGVKRCERIAKQTHTLQDSAAGDQGWLGLGGADWLDDQR